MPIIGNSGGSRKNAGASVIAGVTASEDTVDRRWSSEPINAIKL
jgi:hypothetical protein